MTSESKRIAWRNRCPHPLPATTLATLLLGFSLPAQVSRPIDTRATLSGQTGQLQVLPNDAGATVRWAVGKRRWTHVLSIAQVHCGTAASDSVVVLGARNDGTRIALQLRFNGDELVHHELFAMTTHRIDAIAYDPSTVVFYLLDVDGSLLVARGSTLGGESTWQVIDQVGDLPNAAQVFDAAGGGGVQIGNCVWREHGATWRREVLQAGPELPSITLRGELQPLQTNHVRLSIPAFLTLIGDDGSHLPIGHLPAGDADFDLPAITRLDPRRKYRLHASTDTQEFETNWFRTRTRVDRPASRTPISNLGWNGNAVHCTPGSASFMASVSFSAPANERFTAIGWLVTGGLDEAPPVRRVGDFTILQAAAGVRAEVIADRSGAAHGVFRLPIPHDADQALAWMQALVFASDGSPVGITDVCGIAVGDTNPRDQTTGRDSLPAYLTRFGVSPQEIAFRADAARNAWGRR